MISLNVSRKIYIVPIFIFFFYLEEGLGQLQKTYVCVCFETLAEGLRDPLIIKNAGDNTRRLFIGEQKGIIYTFTEDGRKFSKSFLDISDRVYNRTDYLGERGLLGLAFHPDFNRNGRFFLYYSTQKEPDNPLFDHVSRLSEFAISKNDPNVAVKSSERIIMEIQQPYGNHNGGEILFGDDGYLYIFLGDGGSAGDPQGYAQKTSSLLGKVLRIDINKRDKSMSYAIPIDNPFVRKKNFRPEIYAYGIRNIWRCGKDRGSPATGKGKGRIVCGDVGQDKIEEIDVIVKGGNYGWNAREGDECYNRRTCGKIGPEIWPIFTYTHSIGSSVTGGNFYRGCLNPRMNGFYIFGDYISSKLFRLLDKTKSKTWNARELSICTKSQCKPPLTADYQPRIMSFGEDEAGEVYMVSENYTPRSGKLYRIVDPKRNGDPNVCRAAKQLKLKQQSYKRSRSSRRN